MARPPTMRQRGKSLQQMLPARKELVSKSPAHTTNAIAVALKTFSVQERSSPRLAPVNSSCLAETAGVPEGGHVHEDAVGRHLVPENGVSSKWCKTTIRR